MHELEWRLIELTKNNRDGGDRTQQRRRQELRRLATQLRAAGYRDLKRPEQLGGRHVNALVDRWKADSPFRRDHEKLREHASLGVPQGREGIDHAERQ